MPDTTTPAVPAVPEDQPVGYVVLRIAPSNMERLKRWMSAGHVVSELHILGQPPIDCDVEEAWLDV